MYDLVDGADAYFFYLFIRYESPGAGKAILVDIIFAFPLRSLAVSFFVTGLDMAVGFPAFSADYDTAEQDSLIPAWSVASPAFFCTHLFPALLRPLKQFPVYDLRVIFRAEIIMVL